MSKAHRTLRAVHPRPHSHFLELESGTFADLTQSQLVRASFSSSATSTRGDIGEWVRFECFPKTQRLTLASGLLEAYTVVAIDLTWGAIPPQKVPDMGCAPT